MKYIVTFALTSAGYKERVKRFVRTLAKGAEGAMLRLNGQSLLKVLPPYEMSDAEKKALIEGRQDLMRKARERNKGVPMKVINKEIEEAIDEVRGRKKSS